MFGKKNQNRAQFTDHKKETVISDSTDFKGTLKSDGIIKIFGVVQGDIETANTLIVGKTGRVTANITAQNVAIAGLLKGNVIATERLEIASGGQVYGDVVSRVLVIEEGALFVGKSLMKVDSKEAPSTIV